MKNLKDIYDSISFELLLAKESHLNNNIVSECLNNAIKYIDEAIAVSNDLPRTAFEIENLCLVYDRGISASVHITKEANRIDARMTGCMSAINELEQLQNNPRKFFDDFIKYQPFNINAETAFTKEAFGSLKYLGNEKKASNTNLHASYDFLEKRQDVIKIGKKEFLQLKQNSYEKLQSKPLQKDKPKDHDRSR